MENVISLSQFVEDFGDGLLEAVARQNPPIHDGVPDPFRDLVMDGLVRKPFDAQRDAVQAVVKLLNDAGEPAAIINAEMGTGKTMMAIGTAAVMHAEGARRFLVISPPTWFTSGGARSGKPSRVRASGYSTARIRFASSSRCGE
jgi:Rad3-related DNA helicases